MTPTPVTPPRTGRAWTRRSALTLGLAALGTTLLPVTAGAAAITVGDLTFTVPTTIGATTPDDALGRNWQWQGRTPGPGPLPATAVLARADLASTDPEEILGLVLAGSAAGLLPGLILTGRRSRPMPGGGEQTRVNLAYAARSDLTYHGTLLIATREEAPSALLAVLGDDQLTAGTIDTVLESARWLR